MDSVNVKTIVDSLWIAVCAFLVFLMHAGFALVESGFCRKKNAVMVLLKNVSVVAVASIVFYLVGFGLMFGDGSMVVGLSAFAPGPSDSVGAAPEGIPLYVFLFFQLVFAATAATIVSGAVAERARLGAFLVFVVVASGVIYPLIGHWVWGGGLLVSAGFHDFAGSAAVHAVGGGMALAGAMAVGPRLGKYGPDGRVRPLPAHSFPLAALGVMLLWVGWFGFNGGSTLAADPDVIGRIIVATNLSGSAGFVVALVHTRLRTGFLDLSMALNGALAGLVAITAGCDVIGPIDALVVGAFAGLLVVEGVFFLERRRIDDPVGAIPVHLFAGVFGAIAVGLFADSPELRGVLHGGSVTVLATQAIGATACAGTAFASGFVIWRVLARAPGGIRVDAEHEQAGLDVSECGVMAYAEELRGTSEPLPADDALPSRIAAASPT
jgi:Amt family ammonium transporter